MEQKIAVLRDGIAEHMLTRLLVPGDVVLLLGGVQVPADIEWLEGDVLSIDTAALTGEPLPRKYPSDDHGKLILCGATVKSGEAYGIVRATGINTEIGAGNADIMKDKATTKVSVFESRVLLAVKIIIIISIVDVLVIGFIQLEMRDAEFKSLLLTCLSIIIASIPIALPLVLQVTMALGAGKMAREFDAVVTSMPALQDISSMTTLCSDKTGTLTTAKISIHAESVWTCGDFTKQDVALYSGLASNRDKKEDAIDRSVINHFDRIFGPKGMEVEAEYTKVRTVGFNPIYKRVLTVFDHPQMGRITIAKGLPTKVLNTEDGGKDDAVDQWVCDDYDVLTDKVNKVDFDFSKAGYKTLGVAIKLGDGPFKFVGVLPMLDPPRHDTMQTVENLVKAGINVKMCTGDHLNIAKETARLIGMGIRIYAGETVRNPTQERDELILNADGFAQVLPRDKREVVLVLRNKWNQVVGMTGDGVNDAPALSAAQCGIAVDDATDAAKGAAAIILTSPGLSAIYSGVVESRRIFRKLKSYVTYRFGATVQIVVVLTLFIFVSNCSIDSLFVIILALFNDLTMLPIAYDNQQASSTPENPDVNKLLIVAGGLGFMETVFSIAFAYGADNSGLFQTTIDLSTCHLQTQSIVWLQMFIAAELLIFSARAPRYFFTSLAPSLALFSSVMLGCVACSFIAIFFDRFGKLPISDVLVIWAYDIICLILIDMFKVQIFNFFDENMDVIDDIDFVQAPEHGHGDDIEATNITEDPEEDNSRASMAIERLTNYSIAKNERMSNMDPNFVRESLANNKSRAKANARVDTYRESISSGKVKLNGGPGASGNGNIRQSLSGGSMRPNTPSNRVNRA
jgi:H+-transporting ATPase